MQNTPELVSIGEACRLTSLSRTMIFRLRSEGRFPDVIRLGERRLAFSRAEVIAWIEARIAERRVQAPKKEAA